MDVVSFCPLRVSSLPWQPRPGAHALTVVCKATFELHPGLSPLAVEQEPPWLNDVYRSEDRARGLRAASDMAPFKRRADVLVLGHAHEPLEPSPRAHVARLVVGRLEKTVEVYPGQAHVDRIGLGPVAPTSPARTAMLGRHGATWDHLAWHLRPLPQDIDGAFFNAAPVDQQLADLAGNEPLVLDLLHPEHARLVTRLAWVLPRAIVQRQSAPAQEVRLRCDTLTIDADRGLAMLVWRGVVLLAHPGENGRVAVTAQVEGSAASMPEVTPPLPPVATVTHLGMSGLWPESRVAAPVTSGSDEPSQEDAIRGTLSLVGRATSRPVLPFVQNKAGAPARPVDPQPAPPGPFSTDGEDSEDEEGTGTLIPQSLGQMRRTPVMPFQQQGMPHEGAPAPESEAPTTQPLGNEQGATGRLSYTPFDVPPPAMLKPSIEEAEAPADAAPVVEKPPMLGPLAVVEAAVVEDEPTAAAAEAPPQEAPAAAPEPVELSIEQCATMAAELAEQKVERAKVFSVHGVDERAFRDSERRWKAAIEEEAGNGKQSLRKAYDEAYVARVEGFRGPIELEEYARLVVALERGRANAALEALRIQRPALMPIVRLWTKKIAVDAEMAEKAPGVLREARRR